MFLMGNEWIDNLPSIVLRETTLGSSVLLNEHRVVEGKCQQGGQFVASATFLRVRVPCSMNDRVMDSKVKAPDIVQRQIASLCTTDRFSFHPPSNFHQNHFLCLAQEFTQKALTRRWNGSGIMKLSASIRSQPTSHYNERILLLPTLEIYLLFSFLIRA